MAIILNTKFEKVLGIGLQVGDEVMIYTFSHFY